MIISRRNQFMHMFIDPFFWLAYRLEQKYWVKEFHYLICCVLTPWQQKCHFVSLFATSSTSRQRRRLFYATNSLAIDYWQSGCDSSECHFLTDWSQLNIQALILQFKFTDIICYNIQFKWLLWDYLSASNKPQHYRSEGNDADHVLWVGMESIYRIRRSTVLQTAPSYCKNTSWDTTEPHLNHTEPNRSKVLVPHTTWHL